jgi:short-subunit dehydrogenase
MEEKVVLVTGASSGLGNKCAVYLSNKGYRVFGTYRNTQISQSADSRIQMIKMDVDDTASVQNAISYVLDQAGRIDVVINAAGWGISGPIEEVTIDATKKLFETNFFGSLRVIQIVLKQMRKQKQGLIINVSSIGGVIGLPFQGTYSATKFALEGMTEALRMEVKSFGIDVVLVEPGDFKTNFTKNRDKKYLSKESTYRSQQIATESVVEHDESHGCDPIILARLIEKILRKKTPHLRYRVGTFSQKFVAALKGVVPDRFVQWILMKYYKLL